MKRTVVLLLAGVLAIGMLVFASACSEGSAGVQQTNDPRVTFEGKTLTVTLDENPTTGYLWVFNIDGASIQSLDDEYTADEAEEDMVGVGGTHIYRFEGVSEGTATIYFTHTRSWEQSEDDEKLAVEVSTSASGAIESANVA